MTQENGKKLALWGAWLQLGAVFSLLGTSIAITRAFRIFDEAVATSNESLVDLIYTASIITTVGLIPSLIGLALMAIALFVSKYRAPWFFWFLVSYSAFWFLIFPVGTILGAGLLAYLILHKDEFFSKHMSERVSRAVV